MLCRRQVEAIRPAAPVIGVIRWQWPEFAAFYLDLRVVTVDPCTGQHLAPDRAAAGHDVLIIRVDAPGTMMRVGCGYH